MKMHSRMAMTEITTVATLNQKDSLTPKTIMSVRMTMQARAIGSMTMAVVLLSHAATQNCRLPDGWPASSQHNHQGNNIIT